MSARYVVPPPCDTSEIRAVDLSPDGLPFLPFFSHTHYSMTGAGTTSHRHVGFIEIILCRRGDDISFECEGADIPFRPGDVFVAQPETRHHLKKYPKGLDMFGLLFRLPEGKAALPFLEDAEAEALVRNLRELPVHFTGGEVVRRAFLRVWREYDRPRSDPLRRVRLRLAVYALLLGLHEQSVQVPTTETPAILDALLDEMRAQPGEAYPIGDLARRLGVNALRLNQLFKRATGLPPHAFLTSLRIQQAKKLLAAGDLTVGSIAWKLGYPSSQHFATQFKRETGLTPRAWRQGRSESSSG